MRDRPGDPQTREHFEHVRQKELGVGQGEEGQHVAACLALADAIITNHGGEGDASEVIAKFEELLAARGISDQARHAS